MSMFFDSRGKISVVRTSAFFIVIGLLFVVGSFVYVAIETESSRSPLYVALPPNAEEWSVQPMVTEPRQLVYYKVPTTDVESVAEHYQQEARNTDNEQCRRSPAIGNFPDYVPNTGTVPYLWTCIFQRANIPGVSQTTEITIQPGVPNADPFLDTEGYTVIQYDQRWQR